MVIKALPIEVRNALRTGLIITNASQGVFELVLNSLDAGATSIAIRVDLIAHKLQVVDNGCGMDNHALDLVGLRYMTSKCHSLEDLRKPLGKFGCRGEALASLRNLSRLLMIESRGADNSNTFCKVFKEGKALNAVLSNTQRPSRGTTVTVQDFMYNMPVRRHRIRAALNLEEIKGLIEATALTHPQVCFSLRNEVNGSMIIQTFRTSDTLKTFSCLFGQEIAQSLIHVKHSSGNFKVYGYISTEAHFQNNLQFIYVNKRLVSKTKIHKFVTSLLVKSSIFRTNGRCETRNLKAKSNWLHYSPAPKRETFPVYLLNVKCAYTEYDVSSDQKKTLLEFINWDSMLTCLEEVITKFLNEKHLGNVDDTKTNHERGKGADASVRNEIEELSRAEALSLVDCILSDNSTKESVDNAGTKIIPGYSASRTDNEYDHDPSDRRNQIVRTGSSYISPIQRISKPELEPKTQHITSQLIPVGLTHWVEDPLTPSPATNANRVFVNTISISKQGSSSFLSEDPMVYSDSGKESIICKKYNRRRSSNNDKGIVRAGSHLSVETRQDLRFNSLFSLPLFPNNKNSDEYIGLRDIMRRALVLTLKNLSRTQGKQGSKDKTVKLKITERKLTVNRSYSIQSKKSKNNIAKSSNGNELTNTSVKLNVIKSPYFKFSPVVVINNKKQDTLVNSPLQCVRSPYFAKPFPQQDKNSMEPISNISNSSIVQSPYFKSVPSHSQTSNSTVNTFQLRKCRQTLQIENPKMFANRPTQPTQSKPCNIARSMGLPENSSSRRVVDRREGVDVPSLDSYSTKQYTMNTKNCGCSLNERIEVQFRDRHVGRHANNCQLPSSVNVIARPTFSNFLRHSDNSSYRPLTSFKPKRNYLTTADLICTLETVKRSCNEIEKYMPSPTCRRYPPTVTWGNIQYHSMDEYDHSQGDRSYNPDNASCSSGSSVSYVDPANNKWQSSQRIVQTPHRVIGDDDQSRNHGEERRRPSSSHDGDNELTLETDWSWSSHKDVIHIRNNRFRSVCDSIQVRNRQSSSQCSQLNDPSTHEKVSCGHEEPDDGGCTPQFNRSTVSYIHRKHSPTGHRQSPPTIKFKQLFSLSTSEDNMYEPSTISTEPAEENPSISTSWKRGRRDSVDDVIISKKPRWGNRVVEEGDIAGSMQGYEMSKNLDGTGEPHNSAGSEAVRTYPPVADTISERSSGEDFLAHILQEKPSKWNPSRPFLDYSSECEKVPHVTPDDAMEEGCQLIDAMDVSENAGHEEVSNANTSTEAEPNVDEDEQIHQRQTTEEMSGYTVETDQPAVSEDTPLQSYQRQTTEEMSGYTVETDQPAVSEDTPLQSYQRQTTEEVETDQPFLSEDTRLPPDEAASDSEWVRRLDADGNTIFVHSRTGMTSFEGPVSSKDVDPYSMTSRYDFLPKGISPILKQNPVRKTSVGNDDLSMVKWRDDQPKWGDLIKQMVEDAEKRMPFCEPGIPNTNIPDRTAVGVYNLITSYTFTNEVFTCLEVLGQLDNKFIVTLVSVESAESPHLLVLFDQHAVDERIRLENLVEGYLEKGGDTQFKTTRTEYPIVLNMTAQELRIVSSFEKEFERIGLKFASPTETSLIVTSVPSCLQARVAPEHHATQLKANVETLVKGHANALVSASGVGPRIPNILQTVINSEACRGAIKFGDALSIEACNSMLKCLSECVLPFQCAHGRPSLIPIADMTQIRQHQQQHTKINTKPNYLNIKKYLG